MFELDHWAYFWVAVTELVSIAENMYREGGAASKVWERVYEAVVNRSDKWLLLEMCTKILTGFFRIYRWARIIGLYKQSIMVLPVLLLLRTSTLPLMSPSGVQLA